MSFIPNRFKIQKWMPISFKRFFLSKSSYVPPFRPRVSPKPWCEAYFPSPWCCYIFLRIWILTLLRYDPKAALTQVKLTNEFLGQECVTGSPCGQYVGQLWSICGQYVAVAVVNVVPLFLSPSIEKYWQPTQNFYREVRGNCENRDGS